MLVASKKQAGGLRSQDLPRELLPSLWYGRWNTLSEFEKVVRIELVFHRDQPF